VRAAGLTLLCFTGLAFAGDPSPPPEPYQGEPPPTVLSVSPSEVRMGESIHVTLTPGAMAQLLGDGSKPLTLVLNGHVLPGVVGVEEDDPTPGDHLRFELERTGDNHEAWAPLLGHDRGRDVAVTVEGPGGRAERMPGQGRVNFHWWQRNLSWIPAFTIMLAAALLLVLPLFSTSMYRDGGTGLVAEAMGRKLRSNELGTFSLARLQMGFWFLNVVVAYTSIWAMTGSTDAVTNSILAIIGIGSGTALGASLIDQQRRDELQKLRDEHGELCKKSQHSDDDKRRLGEIESRLCSSGLLQDILCDERGWSFHRVQLLIWTSVLFVVFWSSMLHHFAMPDFDSSMLALMGISSGTYLGFKLPENSAQSS
jgi:hypothetical protein